ncbi:MAG: dienelactone hydrolase family protein [Candidatus Omnitrophica bacterium]|nr:dienelactone hydrolase family protein [Candidatus Omnitrophota bacterium]
MPVAELLTSDVTIPAGEAALRAFLARPEAAKPGPAVLIIHEWWGLNGHIKDVAQRFAREGYAALAPDLYSRVGRKVTNDPTEAAKLMEGLKSQQVLTDLNAATRYLTRQPFVDPIRLGVVGFSIGGTFALMMAAHNSDIKAAIPFYGQIPPTDSLKYLVAPILYIHGGQDAWIVKREAERLAEGLKQFGRPGEVKIYPDCPHAFFNDTRPDVYRPQEARDAWQRTLAFLASHIG